MAEGDSVIGDEFESKRQASLASPRSHPDLLPLSITRVVSPVKWRGVHDLLADYEVWRREVLRLNDSPSVQVVADPVRLVQTYIDWKEGEL